MGRSYVVACHMSEGCFSVWPADSDGSSTTSSASSSASIVYKSSAAATSTASGSAAGASAVSASQGLLLALPAKPVVLVWVWGKEASPVAKMAVPEPLSAIAFSNNSLFVVAGGLSGRIYLWELATGNMLAMLDAHFKPVTSIAFSSDDSAFVTSGEDAFCHTWLLGRLASSVDAGMSVPPFSTFKGHSLPVTQALFAPCSLFPKANVYSSSLDRTVKMWDPTTGSTLLSILFPRSLSCLAIDPLEMIVYSGSAGDKDGLIFTARLYEPSKQQQQQLKPSDKNDGGFSGSNPREADVQAYTEGDMITIQESHGNVLKGHTSGITSLDLSWDAKRIISSSKDGRTCVWDLSSHQLLRTHYLNPAVAAAVAAAASTTHPTPSSSSSTTRPAPGAKPSSTTIIPAVTGVSVVVRESLEGLHAAGSGGAGGGASKSKVAGGTGQGVLPVWKRFPSSVASGAPRNHRVDDMDVELAVVVGSHEACVDALMESWDDIDTSCNGFADLKNLTQSSLGYNMDAFDSAESLASRFHELETQTRDNTQTELERLQASVALLQEHNQALRGLNDELYRAASKSILDLMRADWERQGVDSDLEQNQQHQKQSQQQQQDEEEFQSREGGVVAEVESDFAAVGGSRDSRNNNQNKLDADGAQEKQPTTPKKAQNGSTVNSSKKRRK